MFIQIQERKNPQKYVNIAIEKLTKVISHDIMEKSVN